MQKKVVISGIRATGKLHLGNYLGVMRNFANLSQDKTKKCYFFVANLHTITTSINSQNIMHDLREIVLDYISVGVDPERAVIFAQSSIPETSELMWILSCFTTVAELERMPHFKEKRGKLKEKEIVNSGLLMYPILMAADILGPGADLVPVGEDQHPHIELTRSLAKRFNNVFGKTFSMPEILSSEAVRVPGLDGTAKMGKSDKNTIDLSDSPEVVLQKVSKSVTDIRRKRRADPGDPTCCNIYTMHTIMSMRDEIKYIYNNCRTAGIGCVDCKEILIQNINNILSPIQQRRLELNEKGSEFVNEILYNGGIVARKKIATKVEEVKEKIGIPSY